MSHKAVRVTRSSLVLSPDPARVLLRPFTPGDPSRMRDILARLLAVPEPEVHSLLDAVTAGFASRHPRFENFLRERFAQVSQYLPAGARLSEARRLLAGAYFSCEYSVESAALFNPSLTPHPDQSGAPAGAVRVVLSLRATGEGHISSITFREGLVHPGGHIELAAPAGLLTEARQVPNPSYEQGLFERKLDEMGVRGEFARRLLGGLPDPFTSGQLRAAIDAERLGESAPREDHDAARAMWTLARSNHEVRFEAGEPLSARILFPATPAQRNGIEDARFVRFREDDGEQVYYATFTAYSGSTIVPELVETADFQHFRFLTLNGPAALNKGMALFPRRIRGQYAMLSRQDNENISLMYSSNVHFWNESQVLLRPEAPWEMIQLGNCGSPLETPAGWLVLSHGVGPVRSYAIGAFLLDLDDPGRVTGRLREPLLMPGEREREGYVPNVVYSCGAMIHDGTLLIPYGQSDRTTGFASARVDEILAAMERP